MSADLIARIVGLLVLAIVGALIGAQIAQRWDIALYYSLGIGALVGAVVGFVLTPYVTLRPANRLQRFMRQAPTQQLVGSVLGLWVGLVIAALLAVPLSLLPPPFSQVLPFVAAILFGYMGVQLVVTRQNDVFSILRGWAPKRAELPEPGSNGRKPVLLDTSVIIDGRIADISRTGFIEGDMLVTRFVLNELQHIADSPDTLRRNRGRRGLDMLRRLQSESSTPVRIADMDVEGERDVDQKLVSLARQLRCPIVTNDYNLNRVAELQGVRVLNINELANAVKTVFLPGESLAVKIIQEGKEFGQGVGYLDDGTMVVVEDGNRHMGRETELVVTKVLQTAAGRMLFARLAE